MKLESRLWSELPKNEQKSAYWEVIPNNPDDIMDSSYSEIVYVYFDGRWSVYRVKQQKSEPLESFRFIRMIPLVTDYYWE